MCRIGKSKIRELKEEEPDHVFGSITTETRINAVTEKHGKLNLILIQSYVVK